MKSTHDNNIMAYRYYSPLYSLRHDKGMSNDGNDQETQSVTIRNVCYTNDL